MEEFYCIINREQINSNSLADLDFQNATVSAGYKISDSDEIAVQQSVQINEKSLGNLHIGYQRKFNNNFESKIKIDKNGLFSAFARYNWTPEIKVGATIQASIFPGQKLDGFLSQPLNFGLRITHNS